MSPARAAILALALIGAACNVEVEVLRPGASQAGVAGGSDGGGPSGGGEGPGGSPQACVAADGVTCSGQAGDACDDAHPCCTGSCEADPDGTSRCAYLGGCHQRCESCAADFECCSGRCEADGAGHARCAAAKDEKCLAEGELCTKEEDCCPAGPGTHCGDVGGGEMRCHTPSAEHLPEGATCSLPSDCESGVCVPDVEQLACAAGCRPEGASCSESADCCEPGAHACLPVGGNPSCVASN